MVAIRQSLRDMTAEEFKNTVMPHHRKMTGVAMAILGDAEDVRDCMQDTLLIAVIFMNYTLLLMRNA